MITCINNALAFRDFYHSRFVPTRELLIYKQNFSNLEYFIPIRLIDNHKTKFITNLK